MKWLFSALILLFYSSYSYSQNRTNIMMHGYDVWQFNNFILNHTVDTFYASSVYQKVGYELTTSTSISDSSGNFILASNGIFIENANHDTLLNSIDFNPGWITDQSIQNNFGLWIGGPQCVIILPYPGHSNLYAVFHESAEYLDNHGFPDSQPMFLGMSVVDMNLDNGLGGIPDSLKTIHVMDDTLMFGRITACKHANGRDWWIVVRHVDSNIYFKFLLTPKGVTGPFTQTIGVGGPVNDIVGEACFSPDGKWYATCGNDNRLNIFRFDRCSGDFFDPRFVQVPNANPFNSFDDQVYGNAFSPNSQLLYIVRYTSLLQYNLLIDSMIQVASWDTFYSPTKTVFAMAQIENNNKIFINTYGGSNIIHFINSPDSIGVSCDFIQNQFLLPDYNANLPTFPNYDLGPLKLSPCDTLHNVPPSGSISINPNPASSFINIEYNSDADQQFNLYDILGRKVGGIALYSVFKNRMLEVNDLPPALYLWEVTKQNAVVQAGKIEVVR